MDKLLGMLLRESFISITANRMRTFLTTLGIIIGIASVVVMLAIGTASQQNIQKTIGAMGSNLLIVLSGSTSSGGVRSGAGNSPTLTIGDALAMRELVGIESTAPVWSSNSQLVYETNNWSTGVNGVTETYLFVRDWELQLGQEFTERDVRGATLVAVIGTTVRTQLFGEKNPIGETIRIKNVPFQVIGLLKSKGQNLNGQDQDDIVIIPITTAQRKVFGTAFPGSVRNIMVKTTSAEMIPVAQRKTEALLRERHRLKERDENDFTVRNLTAVAESAASTAKVMSTLLAAIASISLVVGGIGIMNIMLVSVTERTREIGIRKAIGATEEAIMMQFLLEAVIISALGSVVGLLIGIAGAFITEIIFSVPASISGWSVVLSLTVATTVGIFFGFYPARKAALLSPIEALRYQ